MKFLSYFPWKELALLMTSILASILILEFILRLVDTNKGKSATFYVKNYEYEMWDSYNKDGLRGPLVNLSSMHISSIFMIGDSFIYGIGTKEERSIPAVLEKSYKNDHCSTSVFNLGRPGAGPTLYAQTANWYEQYKPNLVIIGLYIDNDIEDRDSFVQQERQLPRQNFIGMHSVIIKVIKSASKKIQAKPKYSDGGCPAKETTGVDVLSYNLPDHLKEAMCNELMNPHLLPRSKVGDNNEYYYHLASKFDEGTITKSRLLKIRDVFPNSKFVLMLIPSKYQVSTQYFEPMKELGFVFENNRVVNRAPQDSIIAWANKNGINTIDLLPLLQETENINGVSLYYKYDDHLNEEGNRIVADFIYKQLNGYSLCR